MPAWRRGGCRGALVASPVRKSGCSQGWSLSDVGFQCLQFPWPAKHTNLAHPTRSALGFCRVLTTPKSVHHFSTSSWCTLLLGLSEHKFQSAKCTCSLSGRANDFPTTIATCPPACSVWAWLLLHSGMHLYLACIHDD